MKTYRPPLIRSTFSWFTRGFDSLYSLAPCARAERLHQSVELVWARSAPIQLAANVGSSRQEMLIFQDKLSKLVRDLNLPI